VLLDTSFLIDLSRDLSGRSATGALEFLTAHRHDSSSISLVSWLEFAEGFPDDQEEDCRLFLKRFQVLIPDAPIAWRASRIA